MIIWFAFAIPIIVILVQLVLFRRRVVWWEFLLQFFIPVIIILICKLTVELTQARDTEYWGGWATTAQYYEYWDEYIYQTCTREYACGTDANGNTTYCTETYDCSYVDYHYAYWQIYDSNGLTRQISEGQYNKLVRQFGATPEFVDMKRDYHWTDGNMYQIFWDGNPATLEPVITKHSYENKVAVSKSVFNFEDVDEETAAKYELYEYPDIYNVYELPIILGNGGPTHTKAEKRFQYLNATLGAKKQVRFWVCMFMNQPLEAGFFQENYWKGGNKNEFILTIGVDKNYNVQWCHPFSWSEVEILKVEAREYVAPQKMLDLVDIADWLGPKIDAQFIRKPFAEFDYLTVEPSTTAVVITYLLTIISSGLICWIVVANYHTEDTRGKRRRRGHY